MKDFLRFLFSKTYDYRDGWAGIGDHADIALEKSITDVKYHFPELSSEEVIQKIQSNSNELPVFLYRLGNEVYNGSADERLLGAIHWIMRECCACEIYYSNQIGEGLYIMHGIGTVIGSRNIIGRGFKIYQNCTVGHKQGETGGCVIGSDVTMFAGSQIIGRVNIGDNVVIGSRSLVLDDMPSGVVCYGSPAAIKGATGGNE